MNRAKLNNAFMHDYIIERISNPDADITVLSAKDKLRYAYDTFISELGHEIPQIGQYKAFNHWISGLCNTLAVDFANYDILQIAHKMGSLPDNATETQEYKILTNWQNFVTNHFFKLCRKYKVVTQ